MTTEKGKKHAVSHIVRDIEDPNMAAQVPKDHIPASKQPILHKELSVSEIHQQKQANAEAKVGMRPKMNKMMIYGSLMQDENNPKGTHKLKKFMEKCEMKKQEKGVHEPKGEYFNAGQSRAGAYNATAQRAKSYKSPGSEEVYNYNTEKAKDLHREKLKDLKEMPKPNLPKSEHQPHPGPSEKDWAPTKKQPEMSEEQRIAYNKKMMEKFKAKKMSKAVSQQDHDAWEKGLDHPDHPDWAQVPVKDKVRLRSEHAEKALSEGRDAHAAMHALDALRLSHHGSMGTDEAVRAADVLRRQKRAVPDEHMVTHGRSFLKR